MMRGLTIGIVILMSACVARHERPMRGSEDTILSDQVAKRLAESEQGYLDTREHSDILCRRVRITGSHMVTRVCYTMQEDEDITHETRKAMDRIYSTRARPRIGG